MKKKHSVYLFSDFSGNLIQHFISAVLTQFPRNSFDIILKPFIKTEAQLLEAMVEVKGGVVVHGFIDLSLKKLVEAEARKRKASAYDLTGPFVNLLVEATGVKPHKEPQDVHVVDDHYMHRIQAVDFTLEHDDGLKLEDLDEADIVLVGISRVSKTPTALFLAYNGFKIANVSFVPSQGLPDEMLKYRKQNVVALTYNPAKLAELRSRRFWQTDNSLDSYADRKLVIREVMDAEAIYKKKKWPMIDTTDRTIEETSRLILTHMKFQPRYY